MIKCLNTMLKATVLPLALASLFALSDAASAANITIPPNGAIVATPGNNDTASNSVSLNSDLIILGTSANGANVADYSLTYTSGTIKNNANNFALFGGDGDDFGFSGGAVEFNLNTGTLNMGTGSLFINAGNGDLGNGGDATFSLNGGTLILAKTINIEGGNNGNLGFGGNASLDFNAGNLVISESFGYGAQLFNEIQGVGTGNAYASVANSAGAKTIEVLGNARVDFNAALDGTGLITKTGAGAVEFSETGLNTNFELKAGTVILGADNAIGGLGAIVTVSGKDTAIVKTDDIANLSLSANIVLNNTLTVGVNSPNTFSDALTLYGDVTGDGGINKFGDGWLGLFGNNTYTGKTTVNEGGVAILSNRIERNVEVGNSSQTPAYYFVGSGSTVEFDAANSANNTFYAAILDTPTITGDGTGSIDFTNINGANSNYDPRIRFDTKNLVNSDFVDAIGNAQTVSITDGVNIVGNVSNLLREKIQTNKFVAYELVGGNLVARLRNNVFIGYEHAAALALVDPMQVRKATWNRLSEKSLQCNSNYRGFPCRKQLLCGNTVWANYIGRAQDITSDISLNSHGVQTGFDILTDRWLTVGLMFGWEDMQANSYFRPLSNRENKTEADNYFIGLYAMHLFYNGLDVRGSAGFGWQNYDATRHEFGGAYRSKFDGKTFEATLEVGKRLQLGCYSSLRSFFGVDVFTNNIDGVQENPWNDGTGAAVRYDDQEITQLYTRVGFDYNLKSSWLSLMSGISYAYQILDEGQTAGSLIAERGLSGTNDLDLGASVLTLKAGATAYLGKCKKSALFGNYNGDAYLDRDGGVWGHTFTGGFQYKF